MEIVFVYQKNNRLIIIFKEVDNMKKSEFQKLLEEEKMRNIKYVWKKPLIIGGRVIKPLKEDKENRR
jgi:hypothetical protein